MKPEFAFYYPGQYWHDTDWIKNLVCFFDGIAMLVPEHMPDVKSFDDYPLAASLQENNLLHIIRPEQVVDSQATEKLATALMEFIDSGVLESLFSKQGDRTSFGSLSMSRLGFHGNKYIAKEILNELKKRGLAEDSEDGVSVPIHRSVRTLILILLAQILRTVGDDMEITLSPATDRAQLVNALMELVTSDQRPAAPTNADVIAFDMATVGVDMSKVPMDELLDYRQQNLRQHRNYILMVRKFARELSMMDPHERTATFEQREEELNSIAQQLRNGSRRFWRKQASLAFSLAGVAWNALSGDPVAAILAAGSAFFGADSNREKAGVYSYLFSTPRNLYY